MFTLGIHFDPLAWYFENFFHVTVISFRVKKLSLKMKYPPSQNLLLLIFTLTFKKIPDSAYFMDTNIVIA